ncbi:MAG: ComEC family competence protein, partial [Rhodospirillales bacterium]
MALWLPVLLGSGIALYFALDREPEAWIAPTFLAMAIVFAALGRSIGSVFVAAVALAAIALGFTVAHWRSHDVAAPVLERRLASVSVTGRIVAIEARAEGERILLDRLAIAGLPPSQTPERIRV